MKNVKHGDFNHRFLYVYQAGLEIGSGLPFIEASSTTSRRLRKNHTLPSFFVWRMSSQHKFTIKMYNVHAKKSWLRTPCLPSFHIWLVYYGNSCNIYYMVNIVGNILRKYVNSFFHSCFSKIVHHIFQLIFHHFFIDKIYWWYQWYPLVI